MTDDIRKYISIITEAANPTGNTSSFNSIDTTSITKSSSSFELMLGYNGQYDENMHLDMFKLGTEVKRTGHQQKGLRQYVSWYFDTEEDLNKAYDTVKSYIKQNWGSFSSIHKVPKLSKFKVSPYKDGTQRIAIK